MGIWSPAEAFYIEAMLFSSTSALQSAEAVGDWLDSLKVKRGEDSKAPDQRVVLDSLQNLIIHAATLSKYFWPPGNGEYHQARGLHLRERFGIKDDSPLKSRALRNAIEHFDERLDNHMRKVIVGYVIPFYVGPTPRDMGVPLHVFRAYYLDTGIFQVLEERYDVLPIIDEVERLHDLLAKRANYT
jgi:hypothetical protein